jgi:hypothetical protein
MTRRSDVKTLTEEESVQIAILCMMCVCCEKIVCVVLENFNPPLLSSFTKKVYDESALFFQRFLEHWLRFDFLILPIETHGISY